MNNPITETIGLDLGDKHCVYCVIDQESGEVRDTGTLFTSDRSLSRFFAKHPNARVVMETGTHSPWISRLLVDLCPEVYVANARRAAIISKQIRKSDSSDAELLARFGRIDPSLLHPVTHRSATAQAHLSIVRSRAALVATRTDLVNHARGIVKAYGGRLPSKAAKSIGKADLEDVPAELREPLTPLFTSIQQLTVQIKAYDKAIEGLAALYPETSMLTQVTGVGTLTAVTFILTLENWQRFARSRDVGAFLGLVPGRAQSGDTDKPMRITKAGDRMLRTLLVQCAHYILGRNGPPSDLKRFGERIAERGGPVAKRKAAVAVARKLATLLHALWRSGEIYEPNRTEMAA